MNRIIKVNAGGRCFQTYLSTVMRYPETTFAKLFSASAPALAQQEPQLSQDEVFLDVNPAVFERVLDFMRTSHIQLPVHDDALRAGLVYHLNAWDLMAYAFPPSSVAADGEGGDVEESGDGRQLVIMPDTCVVQLCDHMQHDQGVKRHAMTITYGADGFRLRRLTQAIRRDLNMQLSSTYWQCYQTNERAAFFTTTKVANGAADLMTTSITQRVVEHTEHLGYHLSSSYVTLSPDVVHTSVRMLIHNFIFRRTRLPVIEPADEAALGDSEGEDEDEVLETFQNFEPRHVGPQKVQWKDSDAASVPPAKDRARDIWHE